MGGQEHKVSAFVDQITLYISNTTQMLSNILAESEYGAIANFKMNMEKNGNIKYFCFLSRM